MIRAEQTKRNRQLTLVRSKQNETKKNCFVDDAAVGQCNV